MSDKLAQAIKASVQQEPPEPWALDLLNQTAQAVRDALDIAGATVRVMPGVVTNYGFQYRVRLDAPSLGDYTDTLFRAYVGPGGVYLDTDGDLVGPHIGAEALEQALAGLFGAESELGQRLAQIRAMAKAA